MRIVHASQFGRFAMFFWPSQLIHEIYLAAKTFAYQIFENMVSYNFAVPFLAKLERFNDHAVRYTPSKSKNVEGLLQINKSEDEF